MPQTCSPNYSCQTKWFTESDSAENQGEDVIIYADNAYQNPLVLVVWLDTGSVEIQVEDHEGNWFTPASPEYTISQKDVVKLDRANMPKTRILANGDATFAVYGPM